MLVVSGSLLPDMPPDILASVAAVSKEKGWRMVVDTSGDALKKATEVGVFLLKPNLGELASLAGKEHVEAEELERIGRQIIEKKKCEMLVVSTGASGAILITSDGIWRGQTPKVKTVSTLGAGDSMVAGLCYAISKGLPPEEILRYGIACGTAATMTEGSELCRKADVEKLRGEIKVVAG